MPNKSNIGYYLVLEKRLGDYNLIDINKLDISPGNIGNDIASIDTFTTKFSESELRSSIERSNMARPNYLTGRLRIISDAKHDLDIITKDDLASVFDFQNNSDTMDQNLKNKIFGAYKKIVESSFKEEGFIKVLLERFKNILKSDNKEEMLQVISELPYQKIRTIYFIIIHEEQKKKLEKLRKLEKLSDAA